MMRVKPWRRDESFPLGHGLPSSLFFQEGGGSCDPVGQDINLFL